MGAWGEWHHLEYPLNIRRNIQSKQLRAPEVRRVIANNTRTCPITRTNLIPPPCHSFKPLTETTNFISPSTSGARSPPTLSEHQHFTYLKPPKLSAYPPIQPTPPPSNTHLSPTNSTTFPIHFRNHGNSRNRHFPTRKIRRQLPSD